MQENQVTGVVESIIFRNEENGYSVIELDCQGEPQTIVGVLPTVREGQRVTAEGVWRNHAVYGRQLEVQSLTQLAPDTLEGITRYLASGVIAGVGEATAERIVSHFGLETLDVLRYAPERLREIDGIGKVRAQQIAESFGEQKAMQDVMVFLQSLRIPMGTAGKIYQAYGEYTEARLREDPYRLVREVRGVGFKTADRIALTLGVAEDAPERLKAVVVYLMHEAAESRGHTCLPRQLLVESAVQVLGISEATASDAVDELLHARDLVLREVNGEQVVYTPMYLAAENEVAARLADLRWSELETPYASVEEAVTLAAQLRSVKLSQEQTQAVAQALQGGLTVITGGPGTGKTTVILAIVAVLEQAGLSVELAAPTGRAAKRMAEASGREARTIHRLLEYGFSGDDSEVMFQRNEDNPLKCDALIVDEASMVDLALMQRLLRALPNGCRLILVGDVDQLPPVGAGDVLRALLDSGLAPSVRLTAIFRQAQESLIVMNAHKVNQGEMPDLYVRDRDFFFERRNDQESAYQAVEALVTRRLPGFLGCDPVRDIQVLCPMKKGELGVNRINERLQEALNPPDVHKREVRVSGGILREGDKVMQVRNNYKQAWRRLSAMGLEESKGIFNGDVGMVQAVEREAKQVRVLFDDGREAEIAFEDADDLVPAYAVSIHKSQGSEFPVVVLPLLSGAPMLMTRNLLYTAITRAKRMVMIVGSERAVHQMVQNNTVKQRYSGLRQTLRRLSEAEDGRA